ncbi:5-(carboxyamino)imidazole ribonucleotide synthase [Micropruina sonneratiae]|uniref:5-(carboxyamino)imidazole ribonucleotide synthase n=1 Tax=Micropruina sonneratiae TaxID=2986940 RepID=UPI0039B6EAF0
MTVRTIGIIGGGQLARMMHAASIPLGVRIALLAEGPDVSAAQVVADVTVGDYTDPATVYDFARRCDVVTFDHEHVPQPILRGLLERGVGVHPGPDALVHAQDKVVMRERLSALGVPCPAFAVVADPAELVAFGERTLWPVIAKTSRGGYDGKGVWKIDGPHAAAEPFAALKPGVAILAEEFIDFSRELSVLVARRPSGEERVYPVSETVQTDGICTHTFTPAPGLSREQSAEIEALALRIAAELGVTGILAVELMQRADGSVVVNELAMRPHNTGHWSIDGAATSQFENHLRAVADLPLGPTTQREAHAAMVNVLGGARDDLLEAQAELLAGEPGARVQLYGKSVVPGRKVGHVTVVGPDAESAARSAQAAADHLMGVQS